MKRKTVFRILLGVFISLLLIAGILFAIGYYRYSQIIRAYVTETVARESKGIYKAEIGELRLNVLAGNFTVENFTLTPDTALYRARMASDTLAPLLLKVKVDKFRIRSFNILDALRNKAVHIKLISLGKPEITVFRMRMPDQPKDTVKKEKMTSIPLPKGLLAIEIGEFRVEDAKLEFIDCSKDSVTRNIFPVCNIVLEHILVDSAHQGKRRLFNTDDIRIDLGAYSLETKNHMNRISFGGIALSTKNSEVILKKFRLEPLFSKHDYTRKLGFQTDWMDISVGSIRLKRLDMRSLLFEGKIIAGLLEADTLDLVDYRDKRVAVKPGFRPPMPQDGIRKIKNYLKIDSVVLNGGKALYEEQTGKVPGTIWFDKLKATLTGLTNDSVLLAAGQFTELRGTAWMYGQGRLDATVRLHLADKTNRFTWSGQLGPMDLTAINPMLSNLLPAKVVSGKVQRLEIPFVEANDNEAKGHLIFRYNDLKVEVTDEEQTTWAKVKTGVINFAANDLIVNDDNPTASGKLKTGVIFFKRDKGKGIINFFWKSAFSGLKSTMGFNSKAQKALLKEEKAAQQAKSDTDAKAKHDAEKTKKAEEKEKRKEERKAARQKK